jgi:hypothetical protein
MYDWRRMLIFMDNFSLLIPLRSPVLPYEISNSRISYFSLNLPSQTVVVAQLVRALDCGSRGRGFEPRHPPIFFFLEVFSCFFTNSFR